MTIFLFLAKKETAFHTFDGFNGTKVIGVYRETDRPHYTTIMVPIG